jgi:formamidopyrimidine-DNA glycosylase
MPELPDLQVFSHNLSKKLVGKTLEKLHAINLKKLKTSEKDLNAAVAGAVVLSVSRQGKELYFAFDSGQVLAVHLMLKGQLHLWQERQDQKFKIVEFLFTDGTCLAITDFQRQASVTLNPPAKSGIDALSKKMNARFLREVTGRSNSIIKKVLTDQQIICGIGNAYADEILWHARISPFAVSNKIPDTAVKTLAKSIKTVLKKAENIILKTHPEIISGEVRDHMLIHHPRKTVSPTGATILVTSLNSRKTYYTEEQRVYQ